MSNAKHTPGPWHVDFYTDTGGFCVYVETPTTATICSRGQWEHRKAESEANARLIGAAPELLAALRLAVRQNQFDMLMTGEELRKCEVAIANATVTSS